ncbi:MAG TPA: serine hydrolase domain-containing protein [Planctomycetaceae bacterium]|nr:serine hydrolase domain-containing protein [Planctomycetaceae bacterium]
MKRRTFLQCGFAGAIGAPLLAALRDDSLDDAVEVLAKATASGQVASAVLHVAQRQATLTKHFGKASSGEAMFLLGSISKPICVTALMRLFDQGEFRLDDRLQKFLPKFAGNGREQVTLRQVLTHVSGLPDQLAANAMLRKNHAGLAEFVEHAIRTPVEFVPGSKSQYSSMGILLATHVAELISGTGILELVEGTVMRPLGMQHSAQGLGRFALQDVVPCQTEFGAPESGAGDPTAKDWDWNSLYWRKLGAPWGGTHASAPDVGRFLAEFLSRQGAVVKPETAQLMTSNQNGPGLTPRGLGFNVSAAAGSPGCSAKTFGHTGSTGTLAWADPSTETICVVLTSLPGTAAQPHPRALAGAEVAAAAR